MSRTIQRIKKIGKNLWRATKNKAGKGHHSNQHVIAGMSSTKLIHTERGNTLPLANGLKSESVHTLPRYEQEDRNPAPEYWNSRYQQK